MTPQLIDLSESAYHADRMPGDLPPTLSASIASRIVLVKPGYGSALNAWTHHPRLGGAPEDMDEAPEKIKQKERGKLLHTLLLGKGADIVEVNAKAWNTNAAKAERSRAQAAGKQAVLAAKLRRAQDTAELIRMRLDAAGVVLDGKSEMTGIWESTGGVLCRRRFDHVRANLAIVELKSCASAHPDVCRRTAEAFGYDIAAAASIECMEALHPELAGGVSYQIVFCEVSPPNDVVVVECAGSMLELGRRRWRRAVATWGKCLAARKWPGYSDSVVMLEASDWAQARESEAQLDAMENPGADF